jgi:hypothetical protein
MMDLGKHLLVAMTPLSDDSFDKFIFRLENIFFLNIEQAQVQHRKCTRFNLALVKHMTDQDTKIPL